MTLNESSDIADLQMSEMDAAGTKSLCQKLTNERQVVHQGCRLEPTFLGQVPFEVLLDALACADGCGRCLVVDHICFAQQAQQFYQG